MQVEVNAPELASAEYAHVNLTLQACDEAYGLSIEADGQCPGPTVAHPANGESGAPTIEMTITFTILLSIILIAALVNFTYKQRVNLVAALRYYTTLLAYTCLA